jgi:hypothetical protein
VNFSGAMTIALRVLIVAGCLGAEVSAQSIFTCVDARGRKLTADRPIAECNDRTQRELTRAGVVREIGPSLTAKELAADEARDKLAAESRARDLDNKRRDRALLQRYPNREVHDIERAAALAQVDQVVQTAAKRSKDLAEQRKAIDSELEFYVKDPSKAPLALKRRVEENSKNMADQNRFFAEQDLEKKRINTRFDEELVKLKSLWAMLADAGGGTAAAPRAAPRP